MICKIIRYYKKYHSVNDLIKLWFRRYLGIEKQQNSLTALFYFLNTSLDIKAIPPTSDPSLRILQLCDTELLRIFSDVCHKHNMRYWLYGGTLLGAVRHKGFIPWDDDTDVSMLRSDFQRAVELFPEELGKYGIEVKVDDVNCAMKRIGLGYRHYETGIWLDVFPVDSFKSDRKSSEIERKEMDKKAKRVRKYFDSHKSSKDAMNKVIKFKAKVISEDADGKNRIFYDNMEFPHHFPRYYDETEIFPLKTLPFEDIILDVPADYDRFLTKMYGNYMAFPKSGIEHHGNGSIKMWAQTHGVDMNDILTGLKSINIK